MGGVQPQDLLVQRQARRVCARAGGARLGLRGARCACSTRLSHFFNNLRFPIVFVNDLLQGKPHAAARTLARFQINTFIGVLGLLRRRRRLGGSSRRTKTPVRRSASGAFRPARISCCRSSGRRIPRDAVGLAGDSALGFYTYFIPVPYVTVGASAINIVNERARYARRGRATPRRRRSTTTPSCATPTCSARWKPINDAISGRHRSGRRKICTMTRSTRTTSKRRHGRSAVGAALGARARAGASPRADGSATPSQVVDGLANQVLPILQDKSLSIGSEARKHRADRLPGDGLRHALEARPGAQLDEVLARAAGRIRQAEFKRHLSVTYGRNVESYHNEKVQILGEREESRGDVDRADQDPARRPQRRRRGRLPPAPARRAVEDHRRRSSKASAWSRTSARSSRTSSPTAAPTD